MKEDLTSKISIIIRNRNENEYIGFALQSCIEKFDKPEIIIVDNNSSDDSLEIVNLFKDRAIIKVINISDYSPGKSINQAVILCSYENILILSAHAQILNCDLKLVNKYLETYRAVFGNQIPIYKGKKISKRYIWSHFIDKSVVNMYSSIENRYFLHNAFAFYKKSFLLKKPMPENFSGKEDRYWAANIVSEGEKFLYTPELVANHFYTGNGATWKGIG
tara:strand:+ start:4035 stop:4691 length:657 start_codon:yes stop_codon:yes gene_type:complete